MSAALEAVWKYYAPEMFMTPKECMWYKQYIDENNRWTFLKPFPHAFHKAGYCNGGPPRTLMELQMIRLSAKIRLDEEWGEKKQDPSFIAKWKEEADKLGLTEAQFKYVIAELDLYASLKTGPMEPSVVDGVWQANRLFSEELRTWLIQEVAKLENIPESQKDCKLGSRKQILSLVDPSLFCLVHGVTKQVEEDGVPSTNLAGGGKVIPPPNIRYQPSGRKPYMKSENYQWLPSEFYVSDTGEVEIKSYVNNLHPEWHGNMYKILTEIFKGLIPMLTKTLSFITEGIPRRMDVNPFGWYTERPTGRPEYDSDGEEIVYGEFEGCELIMPDAPVFETLEKPSYDSVNLLGKNLQVIVDLKNIVLTPDNPVYPGEPWNIHGMLNEQIVASTIWYYQWENIDESKMHFRQGIYEPDCQEFDYDGVRQIYGLVNGDPLNQYLGAVVIRADRCFASPNLYQYRMDPLELTDKTKPGYCKILAFLLVDPAVRVLSTADVPPQQKSWYVYQLQGMEPFNRLPLEILQKIVSYLEWPMSLEDAKRYREKLEEERKDFTTANNENYFERCYSPR